MFRPILIALLMLPVTVAAGHADVAAGPSATPAITLPQDGDDYSRLVAQAAAHDGATDFHALRFAWLDSAARKRHGEISLRTETSALFQAAATRDDAAVRDAAVKLLSLDYGDFTAQSFLAQACLNLHDQPCADQARFAGQGLLDSILKTGDGKTCPTGWEVATVPEEYALLRVMGLRPRQQALIMDKDSGHNCDALTVTAPDGTENTLYFNIDRVMADEMKMFGGKKP